MYSIAIHIKERTTILSFIMLFILLPKINYAQYNRPLNNSAKYDSTIKKWTDYNKELKQNYIGIQIKACALPKANINTIEGTYQLKSSLQSSFSIGMNYLVNRNSLWGINSGLHMNITKRNFFIHIPDNDLKGFLSTEGAPQIEDKEVFFKLVVPLTVVRNLKFNNRSFWNLKAGINLNYSGFSSDETITTSIADTNYQLKDIFNGNFNSNNNKKPWITFVLSSSKIIFLKNNNLLSVELFFEYSKTDFLKGEYEITIPDKPVTRGTYAVTG
jgi:hypothetical protein